MVPEPFSYKGSLQYHEHDMSWFMAPYSHERIIVLTLTKSLFRGIPQIHDFIKYKKCTFLAKILKLWAKGKKTSKSVFVTLNVYQMGVVVF